MRLRTLAALVVLVALISASPVAGQERARLRVVVLPGSQWYVVETMQRQGIAAKHRLDLERIDVASVEAIYTNLKAKAADIAFAGWVSNLQLRAQGFDFVSVFPLTEFHNDILVRDDSPVRAWADLKGKRIGLYGGPAGTTTAMFKVQALKFFGLDPEKESKIHFGASPLLGGLLEKGEVDAIMVADPVTTNLLLTRKFRSIGNLNDIHRERTGDGLLMLTITSRDEVVAKQPEAVRSFNRAYVETVAYMRSHPAIWEELGRASGIKTKEGAEMLRQRLEKNYLTAWDEKYVAKQLDFARQIQEVLGKKYLPEIPPAGFTLKLAP